VRVEDLLDPHNCFSSCAGPSNNHVPTLPPPPYTHHEIKEIVTNEGSPAVCDRTAVVASPARYEVILVSPAARRPLRGRCRMPVTNV